MRVAILLAAALLLGACAGGHAAIHGTGEQVAPPFGWVDYCYRHADDVDCKPLYARIEAEKAEAAKGGR